jgi:putative DNA primase/helicase
MNLHQMARALGGEIAGRSKVLCPGPAHSQRDRSLSVTIDPTAPDGFLTYSFAGDDWQVCRDYVRDRLGMPAWEPGDGQDRRVRPDRVKAWDRAQIEREIDQDKDRQWTPEQRERIAVALSMWEAAGPVRGTLGVRYLREHRGISRLDAPLGRVLRFHAHCPWEYHDPAPAIVALFTSIYDDTPTGVHRIFLDADGQKAERLMRGITGGSAIKLDPIGPELAIGEGIETCLAWRELYGLAPAWAMGSEGGITRFPVLDGVEHLIILMDNDQAGRKAAIAAGERWEKAGRRVTVTIPKSGEDFNKELEQRACSGGGRQ